MPVPYVKKLTVRLVCVLLALAWGSTAQGQYLLTGNSGGELQIGTGLPLPIGPNGIYLGGMESTTGGVTFFPDLLVPPNTNVQFGLSPTRTIMQTGGTANGGQVTFPPAVLTRLAPGAPVPIAVFTTNPAVFQVATSVDYAWPAATATFAPGGAPGPAVLGTALAGGVITYSGGATCSAQHHGREADRQCLDQLQRGVSFTGLSSGTRRGAEYNRYRPARSARGVACRHDDVRSG
jgi:hypothetical protein